MTSPALALWSCRRRDMVLTWRMLGRSYESSANTLTTARRRMHRRWLQDVHRHEVSKHNHVRIFPGTHKQNIGSPYIKPSPLRRRESPWQFAHALFANVSWRPTMASQAALEAADEARRYDRESAPSPEPRRSAPLTARLRQTQRRTIRRRSRWTRLLICWQGTSESLPPPGHLNLT